MADSPDKAPRSTDRPSDRAAPKKPYSKPRLEVYGDLREITGHVGLRGQSDHFGFLGTHS